jgi:hypothetical protein
MKKLNLYVIIAMTINFAVIFFPVNLFAQAPFIEWQKSLGGMSYDEAFSIQQTTDGGYIVAGASWSNDGDITGNHGDVDYWVVKLNTAGNIQWQKSLGGINNDMAFCFQQTVDGGYVIAGWSFSTDGDVTGNHGNGDCWVVKLDTTGNIQWQKCLGGTDGDGAYSIQQTSDGGYVVAGWSCSTDGDITDHHGTNLCNDYWVVKLDTTGNIQWQKCLGGTDGDGAYSIQQTSDGGYIVAGWSMSNDGDVTGNHGNGDYWVVKLDTLGNIQWQKCLGGIDSDGAYSIQQTSDSGYVVAGWSSSNDGDVISNHGIFQDYWIVKLDVAGTIKWQKCLGGTAGDEANSIQQTSDGGYVVAGWSSSTDGDIINHHGTNSYNDCWIVKLTFSPIGVENISSFSYVKVYPNPFTDFINIDIGNETVDIKLINTLGQIVLEKNLQQGENRLVSGINIIPAGVYTLRIQDADNVLSKIMIKK